MAVARSAAILVEAIENGDEMPDGRPYLSAEGRRQLDNANEVILKRVPQSTLSSLRTKLPVRKRSRLSHAPSYHMRP